jgi:hypothetical protein
MASGATVVIIHKVSPPATLFAAPNVRAGGSTPAERVPLWQFDASTIEYMDFYCQLQGYAGGGLTFTLPWSATSATTGVTRWGIGIRRIADDAEDVDTSQTYDYNDVDDTTASATGEFSYPTLAFTNGADMDSWAEGEMAIVRVRRNASHANDTMAGDAELLMLWGKET